MISINSQTVSRHQQNPERGGARMARPREPGWAELADEPSALRFNLRCPVKLTA